MEISLFSRVKLNLGGGHEKLHGFINLDLEKYPEVNIQCDLSKSIPLKDNSVHQVRASHFLEHLTHAGWVTLMHEIIRVCKHSSKVVFIVPHFSYEMSMILGHTGTFPPEVFKRMETDERFKKDLFGDYGQLKLERIEYAFTKEGLKFCRKLGITPKEGAKFLNNIAHATKVIMRVIKE
jgi:hypothetical protein